MELAFIPIRKPRGIEAEQPTGDKILWKQINTYDKLVETLYHRAVEKEMSHTHRWRQIIEEDITEVEEEERDTGAYYAAWPMQAYIEGLAISRAIALTYTHEDTWGL